MIALSGLDRCWGCHISRRGFWSFLYYIERQRGTYPCWTLNESIPSDKIELRNTHTFLLPFLLVQVWSISVYTMPRTNKAIQICSDCRESARLKVSNNKRRGGIPKGHYLDNFENPDYAWWFEEQYKDSEKAKGYMRGCLACKKRIKVQGVK